MEYLLAGDFSPGAPDPLTKPVIFMLFGEHAREIITSDTALWFARVLAGAPDRAQLTRNTGEQRYKPHGVLQRPFPVCRKGCCRALLGPSLSGEGARTPRSEPLALAGSLGSPRP